MADLIYSARALAKYLRLCYNVGCDERFAVSQDRRKALTGQDWMDEQPSEGPDPHSKTEDDSSGDQRRLDTGAGQVCVGRFAIAAQGDSS